MSLRKPLITPDPETVQYLVPAMFSRNPEHPARGASNEGGCEAGEELRD
jgi:hypothetical protein